MLGRHTLENRKGERLAGSHDMMGDRVWTRCQGKRVPTMAA